MTNIEAIPHVIRELRLAAGWSQRRYAVRMGLKVAQRTWVSKLENGLLSPGLETFERLATSFSLKPSELMAKVEAFAEEVSEGRRSIPIHSTAMDRFEVPPDPQRKVPRSLVNPHAIERRRKIAESLGTVPLKGKL